MKRDKVINRALSIFFTILSLAWDLSRVHDCAQFL